MLVFHLCTVLQYFFKYEVHGHADLKPTVLTLLTCVLCVHVAKFPADYLYVYFITGLFTFCVFISTLVYITLEEWWTFYVGNDDEIQGFQFQAEQTEIYSSQPETY